MHPYKAWMRSGSCWACRRGWQTGCWSSRGKGFGSDLFLWRRIRTAPCAVRPTEDESLGRTIRITVNGMDEEVPENAKLAFLIEHFYESDPALMNRLMVVFTSVIPAEAKRRAGIQRLFWMPDQVRHDDTIMRRFILLSTTVGMCMPGSTAPSGFPKMTGWNSFTRISAGRIQGCSPGFPMSFQDRRIIYLLTYGSVDIYCRLVKRLGRWSVMRRSAWNDIRERKSLEGWQWRRSKRIVVCVSTAAA